MHYDIVLVHSGEGASKEHSLTNKIGVICTWH